MDLMNRIRTFVRERPDIVKRALVVVTLALIGVPAILWYMRSVDEKAYILFTNGYYYYRNQSHDQAQGSLSQLMSLYPNSKYTSMGLYYLALVNLARGNAEESSNQFKQFMDRYGNHYLRERVYPLWMAVELNLNRPESALSLVDRYFSEFDRLSPSAAEVLYRKGVALELLGRQEDSKKEYEESYTVSEERRTKVGDKDGSLFGTFAFFAKSTQS